MSQRSVMGAATRVSVLLLVAVCMTATESRAVDYASCTDLGVSITISSLVHTAAVPRQLELSWWNAAPEGGDYVGLYSSDPSGGAAVPLATLPVAAPSGYGGTGVPAPLTSQADFTARCLGYWVAYVRGNDVIATACLRTEPTWMRDMQDMLGDTGLRDMFLPGTHDTAAYRNYTVEGGEGNIAMKYTITQEEDVLSQLVHGIRYLDMRVAYYSDTEELWWTNHGVVRLVPLRDILTQVKQFLDNTEEIVIFDIHELTGFGTTMDLHSAFVAWLSTELDGYMTSPTLSWSASLNTIWSSNKRLLVTYNNQQVINAHDNLWTTVQQKWSNSQDVDSLYVYLTGVMASPPVNRAWSAMAELTARPTDVLIDSLGGLRRMADAVNLNVSAWFRGAWGETVNIVACDFFRGSTIVQEAIDWNKRRATGTSCFTPRTR